MVLVMTATPLAMLACGFPVTQSATVIQWHVLGMFVPAFFTGSLIDRFGVLPVIVTGAMLLAFEVAAALSGQTFAHFITSLVLLGVGWNFLFIGGTTLLTRAYRPAERAKTQAAHDFINFGAMSVASLSAGGALNLWGWNAVNLAVAPLLALAMIAVVLFAFSRPREVAA
jgi:MFS family permease